MRFFPFRHSLAGAALYEGWLFLEKYRRRQVREVHDRHKPNCFELYATGGNDFIKACKTDSEGKVVEGKHTVYRMSAAAPEDKDDWIACIRCGPLPSTVVESLRQHDVC